MSALPTPQPGQKPGVADLAIQVGYCVGAMRGVADGMEKAMEHPRTVKSLREIADEAMRVVTEALS